MRYYIKVCLCELCVWILSLACVVGIAIVSYMIGQLHPKYTPEEQLIIRDVQDRYERGELGTETAPTNRPFIDLRKIRHLINDNVEKNEVKTSHVLKEQFKPITWDIGIIAETIWREAKGEGAVGRKAVASVIVNRMKERRKIGSAVCLEHEQFSCWNGCVPSIGSKPWSGKGRLKKNESLIWNECLEIARKVSSGRFNVTTRANHYYNPAKCTPSWSRKMRNVMIIGKHRFGRI